MQEAYDIFLGWERAESPAGIRRAFYIRHLPAWNCSQPPEGMPTGAMSVYGQICGQALARAHARSGDRIAIASYLGKSDSFARAIAVFAERYADQNERDFTALQAAADEHRIPVESGV